jgi:hypothetical protein
MESAGCDATVVISRERGGWRDRFRSYVVMIDEKEAGQVRRGQRLAIPVTSGHHQIFLKIDWCKSATLELDAGPREVIELSCAPGGTAGSGLSDVVARTDAYITLTRSSS